MIVQFWKRESGGNNSQQTLPKENKKTKRVLLHFFSTFTGITIFEETKAPFFPVSIHSRSFKKLWGVLVFSQFEHFYKFFLRNFHLRFCRMIVKWWVTAFQLTELFVSSLVHLSYGFYLFSTAVAGDVSQSVTNWIFKPKFEGNKEIKSSNDLPPIVLVHGIFGFGEGVMPPFSHFHIWGFPLLLVFFNFSITCCSLCFVCCVICGCYCSLVYRK